MPGDFPISTVTVAGIWGVGKGVRREYPFPNREVTGSSKRERCCWCCCCGGAAIFWACPKTSGAEHSEKSEGVKMILIQPRVLGNANASLCLAGLRLGERKLLLVFFDPPHLNFFLLAQCNVLRGGMKKINKLKMSKVGVVDEMDE